MSPMNDEELQQMLDKKYGQQIGSTLPISSADEKIRAADLETAGADATLAPSATATEGEMGKMTVQELDEHRSRNRKRERKPPEVQQGALTLVRATVPQATAPVVSETAAEAPTLVFDNSAPVHHRPVPAIAQAPAPTRMQRLLRWLFVPPTTPHAVDLVQLKRDIKEWTALQNSIDRLKIRQRHFDIRSEIARYIFLFITATFYVLLACAAIGL